MSSHGKRAAAVIAVAVLIGTPLIGLLWETLNELLAGEVVRSHVALAVPAAILVAYLARVLARTVARLDHRTAASPGRDQTESP